MKPLRYGKAMQAKKLAWRRRLIHESINESEELTLDQKAAHHLILEISGNFFSRTPPAPKRSRKARSKIIAPSIGGAIL
jgi:hypothetical protein